MKHSSARNVIERCFGLLKKRWGILRSPSFYPIRTQNKIIVACCLMHNFIRQEMAIDPFEDEEIEVNHEETRVDEDYINTVETSHVWTNFRENLAVEMFDVWRADHSL